MALFGKKICLAFVGALDDADLNAFTSLKYAPAIKETVMNGAANECPGLPVVQIYGRAWASTTYSTPILLDVKEHGFTPYDADEKRKLMKEMDYWMLANLGLSNLKAKPKAVYHLTTDVGNGFVIYWQQSVNPKKLKEYQEQTHDGLEDIISRFEWS